MRREKWTLLLVSDIGDDLRQITFGRRALRNALGGAGFFSVGLIAVVGWFGIQGSSDLRTAKLEREKGILVAELTAIQEQVVEIEENLALIAEKDAAVRVLAGLDPIDAEVLQVGVGGPGSPTLESHPLYLLDRKTGEQAFAVSYDLNALERRSRLLRASISEASDSLAAHRDLLEATPSILPTAGRLTSGFSYTRLHPINDQTKPHEGIDISAPRGTAIMAAAKGKVSFAGQRDGYGLLVEIDHGYGYQTLYGHASQLLVRSGQEISRGDVIALVGSTGISTSPHLHYEVRVNSRPVNPMHFVIPGALP
jgi:murein DD-endopeptidase MepM/ murein hydrolase activator NlpD